jgi:hypothetical protein
MLDWSKTITSWVFTKKCVFLSLVISLNFEQIIFKKFDISKNNIITIELEKVL